MGACTCQHTISLQLEAPHSVTITTFLQGFTHGCELGRGIAGLVRVASQRGAVHALKQISLDIDSEGNGSTEEEVWAEVAVLKRIGAHPNVIELRDQCVDVAARQAVLVLSPGDLSLEEFLRRRQRVIPLELSFGFAMDLLCGLSHIHQLDIIHRDLKPNNLLLYIGDLGGVTLRVCDFGQSRRPGMGLMTPGRQAIGYRCPEMILGEDAANYSFPIDVWAAGTILAEMLIGRPLFAASSEIGSLMEIFKLLGTPSLTEWPGCTTLPGWKTQFPSWKATPLKNVKDTGGLTITLEAANLLEETLRFCPASRITARGAIEHQCFAWTKQRRSAASGHAEAEPRPPSPPHADYEDPPPAIELQEDCGCSGNCGCRHGSACLHKAMQGFSLCMHCRCQVCPCTTSSIYPITFCLSHYATHGLCDVFKAMQLTSEVTESLMPIDVTAFMKVGL